MPLYIVANENGEITKSGSSSSSDISIQARQREFSMFLPELSSEDTARGIDARKYVAFSEDGPNIVDRPEFDVPEEIRCAAGESINVSNLPQGTIVTVDEVSTTVVAGTLELVLPCIGEFEMRLESFPRIPKNVTIVVK